MKNIHLLPTDKPSRIIKSQDNDFVVLNTDAPNWFGDYLKTTKQHIYITSDDKFIKDEYITDGIEVIKASPKLVDAQGLVNRRDWKKIILSTDEDLIKDGVWGIEDEFLEWFVNNPNCKSVEVETIEKMISSFDGNGKKPIYVNEYKIIIPKEEPKQDLPIVDGSYGCIIQTKKQEPKQETLEEASSRVLYNKYPYHPPQDNEKEVPNKLDSVLAKITHQNDLGLSQWYEVVYYADGKWCSYSGSKTFEDGERVVEWKYCKEIF